MRASQFIREFRERADDRHEPFLFSDERIIDLLNEAENEAAERARLLVDDATPAICEIELIAGQREYRLDPRIIDVLQARIDGQSPLGRAPVSTWHRQDPSPGSPVCYSVEAIPREGKRLILDRAPVASSPAQVLRLSVERYPLQAVSVPAAGPPEVDDEPEIGDERLQPKLLYWMLFLAFDSRDSDVSDSARAERNATRFDDAFGPPQSALTLRTQMRHAPQIVRPDPGAMGINGTYMALGRRYRPHASDFPD